MEFMQCKIGDLAETPEGIGTIVGFNDKGEGGRHFLHVLINGTLKIWGTWDPDIRLLDPKGKRGSPP